MANWCSNTVVFEGSLEAIKQLQQLFQAMKERQDETYKGQLPDLADHTNGGYFSDIYWNEGDEGIFQYETKWVPNTEILRTIAEQYLLNFIHDYEEMGNCIYGRASYQEGLLDDVCLSPEEFETYSFDDETNTYHFEGEVYEIEYEILEILLERKLSF